MPLQHTYDSVSEAAGNSLRNFCVRRIPILRLRLDCQFNWSVIVPTEFLKVANIYLANQFKPALGRFFQMFPEHVPMFEQRNYCESTDGYVRPGEQTWRDAFPIPLVRENCAHDVLVGSDGHRLSGQPLRKFFCFASGNRIFQLLRLDIEFNFSRP